MLGQVQCLDDNGWPCT